MTANRSSKGSASDADLGRSRLATFKEIASRRPAVPIGPSGASKNVGCKLMQTSPERKPRSHPCPTP